MKTGRATKNEDRNGVHKYKPNVQADGSITVIPVESMTYRLFFGYYRPFAGARN
jgi:hypothetical protein